MGEDRSPIEGYCVNCFSSHFQKARRVGVHVKWLLQIDLYHTAAMLSLRRIKSLFLHGKPRTEFSHLAEAFRAKTRLFIPPRFIMIAE